MFQVSFSDPPDLLRRQLNCRQYRTIWDRQYDIKCYRQLPRRRNSGQIAFKVSALSFLCELPAYEIDRVGEDVLLRLFTGTSTFTPLTPW